MSEMYCEHRVSRVVEVGGGFKRYVCKECNAVYDESRDIWVGGRRRR